MGNLTIVLGSKGYSSWSLRAWLALEQTGAPYAEVLVALDQPDTAANIRRHSPSGRVPTLLDGELAIWDSLAIGEYLAERFPEAGLWPADSTARAIARAVSAEMHSGFAALRQQMPMNLHRSPKDVARNPALDADIARILEIWRDCRARFGAGGPFLFGKQTLADAMFAPVVVRFRAYAVALDGEAAAYAQAIWSLPAMEKWTAAAVSEARIGKYEL
jgi:glutathione S-transferase